MHTHQHTLSLSQLIYDVQGNLQESRRTLSAKNQNLRTLYHKSKVQDKVLSILHKICYIQSVPEELNRYFSQKQYLHAVRILLHSLTLLCGEDLGEIPSLQPLREVLLTKKNSLQDELIRELQHMLYTSKDTSKMTTEAVLEERAWKALSGSRSDSKKTGAAALSYMKYSPFLVDGSLSKEVAGKVSKEFQKLLNDELKVS